jgi:hypothetical protein
MNNKRQQSSIRVCLGHKGHLLCSLCHASSQLTQNETCIWIATQEAMNYRNKLFLPEVDATECRHGAAVMSLRHGGEESSTSHP